MTSSRDLGVIVQLILADSAQSSPADGKVHMLGAGWSVTGSPTAPQAVVGLIKVPWDRSNEKLPMRLQLLDGDGNPVSPEPGGGLEFQADLEVGRPPGLTRGSSIDANFVINIGPMPLLPGRYEWRLELDNDAHSAPFEVRQA